jgi:hypothetical protein
LGQQVGLPLFFLIKRIGMIRREFSLPRFPRDLLGTQAINDACLIFLISPTPADF